MKGILATGPTPPAVKYLVGKRSGNPAWENVLPPLLTVEQPARRALEAIQQGNHHGR